MLGNDINAVLKALKLTNTIRKSYLPPIWRINPSTKSTSSKNSAEPNFKVASHKARVRLKTNTETILAGIWNNG